MSETNQPKTIKLVEKFNKSYKVNPERFQDLFGVTPNWTPIKLITLYREVRQKDKTSSNGEIAALVDLDRTTVSRKNGSMDWDKFEEELNFLCDSSDEQIMNKESEEERYRLATKQADKVRTVHITNLAMMKHIEKNILDQTKSIARIKLKPFIFQRNTKKTRTPEHMVLLLSDLHVGQEFSKQDTGDLNEYNVALFKKRAEQLRRGVVSIYEHHSEIYEMPELHVFCLGDLVQGSNLGGEWGPAYNSTMDIHAQAVTVSDALCDMVSVWSNYFKKVNIHGVVGNHGRAGVAKNSDKISANWDNVVYSLTKAQMKSHPNVSVTYTDSWWSHRDINGTNFLLVHGDHISGTINSLQNEEQRLQSLVSAQMSKRFNYLCLGHFHNAMELETSMGGILVNGSFVGGDIYSMHKLRHISRPSQSVFGVHPVRGLTWKYKIDLDAE